MTAIRIAREFNLDLVLTFNDGTKGYFKEYGYPAEWSLSLTALKWNY